MSARGHRTREHILDVAEQLYGTAGVANVSLRQIRIAAGQGNEAAVQYHFGDRDGIISALVARHHPRVRTIAQDLVRALGDRPSTRQLVEVLVRPWAEYVTRGPSERAFVKIVAQLGADPRLGLETVRTNASPEMFEIGAVIYNDLTQRMSTELAIERIWTAGRFALTTAADHAVLIDDADSARPILESDEFIENLVDMAAGAVTARAGAPHLT
jgi:AcrR family transcriptional regulator